MSKKPLTPRQSQALQFIRDYIELHGQSPSMEEVARHLKISAPAAYQLIVKLEQLGHLNKDPGVSRSMSPVNMDYDLEREARGIVLLAFRNSPIEDIHAGIPCQHCSGKSEYSRITDEEMRHVMKTAVNQIFTLLKMKKQNRDEYERYLRFADMQTKKWDKPELTLDF